MFADGAEYPRWRVLGDQTIEIELKVGDWEFRIETRRAERGTRVSGGGSALGTRLDPAASQASIAPSPRRYTPASSCGSSCC